MENDLVKKQQETDLASLSYHDAKTAYNESIWNRLGQMTVSDGLHTWLDSLSQHTKRSYLSSFKQLEELSLLNPNMTLQKFSLMNHESVVDEIKLHSSWSEATKQARAAAYIAFTGFLQRQTKGFIRKAIPSKDGVNKTFFKVREKVKTRYLSNIQSRRFLQAMESVNKRDALIAKLILQGGKRKEEVLSLETHQIDFEHSRIFFTQAKTRGYHKETVINYPDYVMQELKQYISNRDGVVFITRNGNKIAPTQIDRNFLKAGKIAEIPFRVTPHVLRVTLVTRLKELKVQDSDIMKITGHANSSQLLSYDKSDQADNASLYHHFV